MEQKKKCTRLGCLKEYYEKDNVEGCCHYHDGKPMFHDIKKGWTCCNTVVYDWDEFQKIPPCKTGKHSSEEQKLEFFKSNTVANAQKAIDKDENGKKIISEASRRNPKLNLITSPKKFMDDSSNKNLKNLLQKDIWASNVYTLGYEYESKANLDYTHKLIIF